MLAEPRKRTRYTLVPRGRALYEDETRFGTKMLEKMGWKKGEGLGANGNGSKDFVKIRYKNDALGLGFEQRDDQWTQHEQSFNGLLKSLNNEENGFESNIEQENELENDIPIRVGFGFQEESVKEKIKPTLEKMKEKTSGVSLEERSKQSKARVHYKKFTRGKDIAQYSEKDLANIFGKKAVDEQKAANDFYQSLNNTFGKSEEKSKSVLISENLNEKKKEKEHNPQIIVSNVSINDYFKKKMETIRKIGLNSGGNIVNINSCNEVNGEEGINKKKRVIKELENGSVQEVEGTKSGKSEQSAVQQSSKNNENEAQNITKEKFKNFDGAPVIVPLEKAKKKKDKSKTTIQDDKSNEHFTAKKRNIDSVAKSFQSVSIIDNSAKEELTQKPTKKKEKKAEEASEIIGLADSDKGEETNSQEKKSRNKSKRSKESPEYSLKDDKLSILNQSENISDLSSKKPPKAKKKKLSSSAKSDFINGVNLQLLDLEEIKQTYKAFSIYSISTFCAEKFRNVNLNEFTGSVLPQIEGYGLDPDLQLDVKIIKSDEERITNLWRGVLNKYGRLDRSKKTYQHYVQKVITARKIKQKRPKLYVKTWKRRNVFQVL